MADNYLEKRYEEVFGARKTKVKRIGHTLDELLLKNRSYRGYNTQFTVTQEMLERIVGVNTKLGSGCNRQVLRFKLITKGEGAEQMLRYIKLGAALPELHLPFPGTEPQAFVIVCSTMQENKLVDIDLGISAQSMLLKATEMGLNGLIIGAFNKEEVQKAYELPYEPIAIIAIGKGTEKIELVPISEDESHAYYRKDGIHYVPKVRIEDLIIK